MSHYVMNYHDAYSELRKGVKAARDTYLKKMERAKQYADSEQGKRDIEAIESEYKAALEAVRATVHPKFTSAIKGMRERAASADMTPPSAEMLATLQMLELRDTIETTEVERAAKLMGNNDAALRTLAQIVTRKGSVMPNSVKSFEVQTRGAVDALERAAMNALVWDGRTGLEILSDWQQARNDFKYNGGAAVSPHATAARDVADIEAASFYKDTAKRLIGDGVSTAVVDALE